ncbi:type II toxin-antitoxin system RelE family toxin [Arthrobacter sp. A5]|uniref:type II toxin-antitoxin system RelE family toxin n=1 Tax=Arthrobacter sp. A5 TaxID=576926 RepID=UPI003DA9C8D4
MTGRNAWHQNGADAVNDEWRVRTDDYRIIREIHDNQLTVLVLRVGHRREIYESH